MQYPKKACRSCGRSFFWFSSFRKHNNNTSLALYIYKVSETQNQTYDYESLKEKVNGFQKEKESYETKIASLTKSNEEITGKYKALETDSLKVKIALENGIPFEMANRLSGTDVDSITKDAKLLSGFVSKTHQQPRRNPEAGSSDDAYSSMLKKIKN